MENDKTSAKLGFWEPNLADVLEVGKGVLGSDRLTLVN